MSSAAAGEEKGPLKKALRITPILLDITVTVMYNKSMTNKETLASDLKFVGWLGKCVTEKQGALVDVNLVTIQKALTTAQKALDAIKVGT